MTLFTLGWLLGLAFGVGGMLLGRQRLARRPGLLPPATARQLRRAARANRLQVRTAYGEGRDLRPRARDDFDFGEDED